MANPVAEKCESAFVRAFIDGDSFFPTEPATLHETGLSIALLESLLCKQLAVSGTKTGRELAQSVGLPFRTVEELLGALRARSIITHAGTGRFNDFQYSLTEQGRNRAAEYYRECAYVGTAPVTLQDYVISVEAQSISTESPTERELHQAFEKISVDEEWFELIGPAVNSAAGMFLYGAAGNGKSTLARCITRCFGQEIWVPRTIIEDGQIIKLFDPSCHQEMDQNSSELIQNESFDRRWVRIRRPTVTVGGELTMQNLELQHDAVSNVSEAPLQLKSNSGCLLIDDFGRQRVPVVELLNRWIIPLEEGRDFLTLSTGKKIEVPFEQLIIFSTNLDPHDLVDEAFLRRIPYKIEIKDPSDSEFSALFALHAELLGCEHQPSVIDNLLARHYRESGRPLRRCHPRDLLVQVRNYCKYKQLPFEMRDQYFDRIVASYFTKRTAGD